ncbi:MAG: LysE family transporter [Verrucomicrobia bacterium]|nr:LysE family transporter [Verrucomicrobiota bacterium]
MDFLVKGIIVGFCIAAPVGPIGILCIKRTLHAGRLSGLACGLGAACADAMYGIIAGFGLTGVSSMLLSYQNWFQALGGLFLLYLGFKIFREKLAKTEASIKEKGKFKDFSSTFILTLTNPLTILSFMAIFAGLGLVEGSIQISKSVQLVAGVFLGSALWWLILAELVTLFRKRVGEKLLLWINRTAGILIFLFGLGALYHLIA